MADVGVLLPRLQIVTAVLTLCNNVSIVSSIQCEVHCLFLNEIVQFNATHLINNQSLYICLLGNNFMMFTNSPYDVVDF